LKPHSQYTDGLPGFAGNIVISTGGMVSIFELPHFAIEPEALARPLSHINRYAGHTLRPYSVAEHSLLVAELVSPGDKLAALLHDAAEAFVNDLPSPIKCLHGMEGYREVEEIVAAQIASHYKLDGLCPPGVEEADRLALSIEVRGLFPEGARRHFPPVPLHLQRHHLSNAKPPSVVARDWATEVYKEMVRLQDGERQHK
jgi:hypothetical protein